MNTALMAYIHPSCTTEVGGRKRLHDSHLFQATPWEASTQNKTICPRSHHRPNHLCLQLSESRSHRTASAWAARAALVAASRKAQRQPDLVVSRLALLYTPQLPRHDRMNS